MTGESLAARVHRLRVERGWTQAQLADMVGISKGSIASIEQGDTRSPHGTTLEALARAFGVTRWMLELGRDPLPPHMDAWPDDPRIALRHTTTLDEQGLDILGKIIRGMELELQTRLQEGDGSHTESRGIGQDESTAHGRGNPGGFGGDEAAS